MSVSINGFVLSGLVAGTFLMGYGACALRAWLRSKLP
jgi:hypothetical protein